MVRILKPMHVYVHKDALCLTTYVNIPTYKYLKYGRLFFTEELDFL